MATSATRKTAAAKKPAASKKPLPKRTASTRATVKKHTPVKEAAVPDFAMAEVPDKSILDGYISRTVVHSAKKKDNKSEFDVFDAALANMWNVLIEGPTGPGKTTAVQAWCAARGIRFASVSSNASAEPSQLFGKYIVNESNTGSQFVWQHGLVSDIFLNGGALLINEMNFLPERISTVLFGPTDSRRALTLMDHKGEVLKAHRPTVLKRRGDQMIPITCWCDSPESDDCKSKWVIIIGDMNPDYEGTRPLNKAFRNRFAVQLQFDYDSAVEKLLIKSASLRIMANDIRSDDQYETPVATNMLIEFESQCEVLGIEFAKSNFINHFSPEERDVVKVVIEAYADNIESELSDEIEADDEDDSNADAVPSVDDDAIEVDEDTFDWVQTTA